MGIFDNESQGYDGEFPPKLNTVGQYTVVGEIERVKSTNEDLCYKKKDKTSAGFYDKLPIVNNEGEESYLIINVWRLYFALKEMSDTIDIDDTIEINHSGSGKYEIKKV